MAYMPLIFKDTHNKVNTEEAFDAQCILTAETVSPTVPPR